MNESTNFGLKTTGDNDQWRNTLDYHNENMGVIDAVLAKNQDALGIIVDGNKAAVSATTGQYIILRNSTITGKTDGLYTAAKSIPANTAIDGTYLTAVSGGGLNALNGNIASIRKLKYIDLTDTTPMNVQSRSSGTINYNNFVGCSCKTNGVMPLPYLNNDIVYIKLVNYSDLTPVSGSVTVRVWYV